MVVRDEDESWLKEDKKTSKLDEVKKALDESYSALGKSIKSLMDCVADDPGTFFDLIQFRSAIGKSRIQELHCDANALMETMTRGEVIDFLTCLKNWIECDDRFIDFNYRKECYAALSLAIIYLLAN